MLVLCLWLIKAERVTMTAKKEETKKTSINFNKLKVRVAKYLAYVGLVVAASYGIREALTSLDDSARFVITVGSVLALVFIISLKEEE